jgi:CHAT domain-containing protein
VEALHTEAAAAALEKPLGAVSGLPIVALGSAMPATGSLDGPLPFARREIESIKEEYPDARLLSGDALTKAALTGALARANGGVVHFAGHSHLGAGEDGSTGALDPLSGELRTSDGSLTLLDVLGTDIKARLVVLSACSTMLARTTPPPGTGAGDSEVSGDEMMSLAESFQIAGAENVLATTMHVNDIAAAMLMKRFYRAARSMDAARALREAEIVVREHYPHPAWWATFVLLAR